MQFYKSFGTGLQFITPPVFFDEKLWCFAPGRTYKFMSFFKWCIPLSLNICCCVDSELKTCPTSVLLDANVTEPKQRFSDVPLPAGSLFVVGLPIGEQVGPCFIFVRFVCDYPKFLSRCGQLAIVCR